MNQISSFRFLKRNQGGRRELTGTRPVPALRSAHIPFILCGLSRCTENSETAQCCLLFAKGQCASIYGQAPLTRVARGAGPSHGFQLYCSHACFILSSTPTVTLKHLQVSMLKGFPVYPLLHRKPTKSDSMSRSNVRSQRTCFLEQQAT